MKINFPTKILKMKKIVLIFMLLSASNSLFSQTGEDLEIPNFTPPSPTAYELGRFGEIPIGMFTGSPNVSVPLVDFKSKKISIPVSLNYSSNGIRVDQLCTKVGLGWNLFAGGIISRTVNQNPDELRAYEHPPIVNDNFFTSDWIDYFFDMAYQIDGISQPLPIDGEPDIFSFNFMGRTGKFTFNNQHEIVLLDDISLKVIYDPESQGGFLITDEQGIKYYFQDKENTRIDVIGGQTQYNNLGHSMTTSWSLSRIEAPNNEVIYFEYDDESYTYVVSQSQHAFVYETNYVSSVGCAFCTVPVLPPTESPIINNQMLVEGKKLSKISTNNPIHGSVNFLYNQTHPEVTNYSLLTSVTLKDKLNNTIENINLSYSNVNDRMFLNEVSFLDPEKEYNFEYHDLYQFPDRLSKSKDHWGYYNGKNNNKLYPIQTGPNNHIENRFAPIFGSGADKEVDENKAKKGLLKKITYPTKGYTELEYESNSYYKSEEVISQEYTHMVVSTDANDPVFAEKSESITFDAAENLSVPVQILFGINYQSCTNETHPDEADRKFFIKIEDLTNPGDSDIITKSTNPIGEYDTLAITEEEASYNNNNNISYFFNFKANRTYRITISVFYQCLYGVLNFTYPNGPVQIISSNKKSGGLRVSKTINYDNNNKVTSLKKYHYASKDDLNRSSGDISYLPNYMSKFTTTGECINQSSGMCCSWSANYIRLNSNNLNVLYRSSLQTTRYQYVTVSEDAEDFSNGGIEYKFKIGPTQPGTHVFGIYSEVYSEAQWSWGDGLELEKTYFKSDGTDFKTVYKETNNYIRDTRIEETISGFKVSRKFFLPCRSFYTTDPVEQDFIVAQDELNVTRYYINVNWTYLSSKTVENYNVDGNDPLISVTNYYFDNPDHAQLNRTEITNSKQELLKKQTLFPQDIPVNERTTAEETLIAQNRIGLPIKILSYKNNGSSDILLSNLYNQYYDWGNNLVATQKVKAAKENDALEDRIQYHDYDTVGNPLVVSKIDGSKISYIWGYDDQYPIAKIENASYAEIATALSLPNANAVEALDENDMVLINSLRTHLPEAMVTTYTFQPLVGVTSIIDPKGHITSYEYDEFNRLEFVKDHEGKLISENKYHYKN